MSAEDVCEAVKRGDLDAVRKMVKANPSLKDEPHYGWAPLQWAAYYGHLHIVRYLAGDAGAAKDKANEDWRTSLMGAAANGHLRMVRYLLEEGADDTLKDVFGKTALTYAEEERYAEVAALLREYLPGGIMEQRRDAVINVVLNQEDLGPDVARFCGEFVKRT